MQERGPNQIRRTAAKKEEQGRMMRGPIQPCKAAEVGVGGSTGLHIGLVDIEGSKRGLQQSRGCDVKIHDRGQVRICTECVYGAWSME